MLSLSGANNDGAALYGPGVAVPSRLERPSDVLAAVQVGPAGIPLASVRPVSALNQVSNAAAPAACDAAGAPPSGGALVCAPLQVREPATTRSDASGPGPATAPAGPEPTLIPQSSSLWRHDGRVVAGAGAGGNHGAIAGAASVPGATVSLAAHGSSPGSSSGHRGVPGGGACVGVPAVPLACTPQIGSTAQPVAHPGMFRFPQGAYPAGAAMPAPQAYPGGFYGGFPGTVGQATVVMDASGQCYVLMPGGVGAGNPALQMPVTTPSFSTGYPLGAMQTVTPGSWVHPSVSVPLTAGGATMASSLSPTPWYPQVVGQPTALPAHASSTFVNPSQGGPTVEPSFRWSSPQHTAPVFATSVATTAAAVSGPAVPRVRTTASPRIGPKKTLARSRQNGVPRSASGASPPLSAAHELPLPLPSAMLAALASAASSQELLEKSGGGASRRGSAATPTSNRRASGGMCPPVARPVNDAYARPLPPHDWNESCMMG